jgi:hypothetical protein
VKKVEFQFYQARFTAVVKSQAKGFVDRFVFSEIEMEQVSIKDISALDIDHIDHYKAGKYKFYPQLYVGRGKGIRKHLRWNNGPFVLMARDAEINYFGKIQQVVFRNFDSDTEGRIFKKIAEGHYVLSGDVFFGVLKPAPEPVVVLSGGSISAPQITNIADQGRVATLSGRAGCLGPLGFLVHNSGQLVQQTTQTRPVQFAKANAGGCLSNLWRAFLFFVWILVCFYLWQMAPWMGLLGLMVGLLWLVSRFVPSFPFRSWYSWVMVLLLFIFLLNNRRTMQEDFVPEQTGDGKVEQDKPEEYTYEDKDVRIKDYKHRKTIHWFDFGNRSYTSTYSTISMAYIDSKRSREGLRNQPLGNDQIGQMAAIYTKTMESDMPKLDSLVLDFKSKIASKRLNAVQAAEMVTTFVQEIDYVLVHDNSCKQSAVEDGDFVEEWHANRKPCMPNVFGGVQGPYEFAHNLKGDCDTRSLLAHALLNRLGISSSVWVSTVYGHSVLGVGVPAGFGSYKEINGAKHYAVELTAKGFKIGMLIPEQRNMSNWVITNFQNY